MRRERKQVRKQIQWLEEFLALPNGILDARRLATASLSDDTFRRVFEFIDPEALNRCFLQWVNTLVPPARCFLQWVNTLVPPALANFSRRILNSLKGLTLDCGLWTIDYGL